MNDIFGGRAETAAEREALGYLSVIAEIAAERERQVTSEGWSPEHDDHHDDGALGLAGACYAWIGSVPMSTRELLMEGGDVSQSVIYRRLWPWEPGWWKPKDRRRDLIRAAALIVAEIERLDRVAK